jgi:isoaspartyl peptidase/L-asparaginase-like protein (Ntn-hydrolase superfamily)
MDQFGTSPGPVVIATWPFGLPASEAAWRVLRAGGAALDAVVDGATFCEDDESVDSVGYGGLPDASGEVTLDASVMDHRGRCGAVACLRRVRHAARVARAVMERTPHVMLAGDAATAFALAQGFCEENLLSPRAREAYQKWTAARSGVNAPDSAQPRVNDPRTTAPRSHDTIGLLALDGAGTPAGACTTSGRAYKLPGRVGDSPIIGAGLYVDGEVGAATATGLGEEVMRVCGSFDAVERMRRGAEPAEALAEVLRRVARYVDRRTRPDADVSLLALRRDGMWAGMTLRAETNFQFAVVDADGSRLVTAPPLPSD